MPSFLFSLLNLRLVAMTSSTALECWEIAEYCFAGLVTLACFGDYVADFTNWFTGGDERRKTSLRKRSTLVLVASLALELICLVNTNIQSSRLIGSLRDLANDADRHATTALDKSTQASALANKTEQDAQKAIRKLYIEELVMRIKIADDARARDELLRIFAGTESDQKEIQILMPGLVQQTLPATVPKDTCINPDGRTFQKLITSPNIAIRQSLVSDCARLLSLQPLQESADGREELHSTKFVHLIVPNLLDVAVIDPSVSIRGQAVNALAPVFANLPNFPANRLQSLDTKELQNWWRSHDPDYDALALLSSAKAYLNEDKSHLDSASVYDIIRPYEHYSSPTVGQQFGSLLNQMRSAAKQLNIGPIEDGLLLYHHGNDCPDIENHLNAILAEHPRADYGTESRSLNGLRYVETCDSYRPLVPNVANFAISTPQLSQRYAAALVLNRWTNSSLSDPFDVTTIKNWWDGHKDDYPTKYVNNLPMCSEC